MLKMLPVPPMKARAILLARTCISSPKWSMCKSAGVRENFGDEAKEKNALKTRTSNVRMNPHRSSRGNAFKFL